MPDLYIADLDAILNRGLEPSLDDCFEALGLLWI